jgi:hypothetical protein
MPYLYTPDSDLSWHGVGYPAGVAAQIPDDLAIALGLTEAPTEPATPLEPTDGQALAAAVERLEELRLIYEVDGWKGIKAIADPLGVKKHHDGWDSSLLLIIEAEYSPEIAAELAE